VGWGGRRKGEREGKREALSAKAMGGGMREVLGKEEKGNVDLSVCRKGSRSCSSYSRGKRNRARPHTSTRESWLFKRDACRCCNGFKYNL